MSDFGSRIPSKVIDYYEGEAANVIGRLIEYIKIRHDDLHHFEFDKELVREFIRFIINRIKEGKNLDPNSIDYLIQNQLKFPGEY